MTEDRSNEARALFAAIVRGDEDAARGLLAERPDLARSVAPSAWAPDAGLKGVDDWSPLQAAIEHGMQALGLELLDAGADMDHRASNGRGPGHDAFEFGAERVLQRLLRAGLSLDAALAAGLGDLDALQAIVDADPGAAHDDATDLEPLGWASFGDQPGAIEFLVRAGARPTSDHLRMAASCGHVRAARVLLDHGVDPMGRDASTGANALHVAASMRFSACTLPVVELLLERGADPAGTDASGRTPFDVVTEVARRSGLDDERAAAAVDLSDRLARSRRGDRGPDHDDPASI
ncbi:MAG: ankyrin repeat domain-containing protein [Planctomycetota bacterium]